LTALSGRTAVVTGASRGIGAAISTALAGAGARVVMIARNEVRLRDAARPLMSAIPITSDVSDPRSVEKASAQIRKELGGSPDIIINNAGIFGVSIVEETTTEFFVETINTNLVGPFLFVRAFLADMKKRKSGHIVTIGSIADRTIFTGNAAYSAAKFGLRAVHEVLRAELKGSGVRTSLISPASTDTEIWNTVTVTDPAGKPHSTRPMLDADDVAAAVMFALDQPERVNVDELRLSHS
jgi:NADP-dependent 3-hydroxy acid dehydrogenase YdfG